ncbi:hypothetical protein CPMB20_03520 [Corynebacterium pseudotuberculosis]|nr:hypothetical protein CPMB20_03520 [Corynebacterium pseudotuberculosis]
MGVLGWEKTRRGGGALVLYGTCVSAQAVNASKEALIMSHAEPEHNGEVAVLRQLPGGGSLELGRRGGNA